MTKRLENRIALITGASRGIGAAVARAFAREGAHVILVARTIGGLEEVDDAIQKEGGKATLVPLDLREFAKIDELGAVIADRYKKLDILVGNAGTLGTLTPLPHAKPDMWQRVLDINLTANFRLIRVMDPLLRASDAGRAMFVSSGVAEHAIAYWGAYATSKAALEMLVKTYALEVEKTSLRVNLINPGEINTKMHAEAFPGLEEEDFPAPETITDTFVELALPSCNKHGQVVRA